MKIVEAEIPAVKMVYPRRINDHRGFFSEIYRKSVFGEHGIELEFLQENHSLSRLPGTVRGLHFQSHPMAQAKLVRVVKGAAFDVAVDIRHGSPTFGRHVAAHLSATEGNNIFIPEGFAHGFCTLEPDTEVVYRVSRYWDREHDLGLMWCDPALDVQWPVAPERAIVSERDRSLPLLGDLPEYFRWGQT